MADLAAGKEAQTEPFSDHDRRCVEVTARLLRLSGREAMAAGDIPTAQLRHVAAVECEAMIAERQARHDEAQTKQMAFCYRCSRAAVGEVGDLCTSCAVAVEQGEA